MYKVYENVENLTISNNIHLFDSPRCTNWILHGFSKWQAHALDWSINTCRKCSVFSIHMTVHTHTHFYTFTSTNIITQKQKKEKCVSTNIKTSSFTMFQLVLNPKTQLSKWMKTSKHFAIVRASNSLTLKCSFVWASGVVQVCTKLYNFCFVLF